MNPQTVLKPASGSYVALVEDGVPKFSASPVRHATKQQALTEAQRLARKYPGQLFQVFGGACSVTPAGFAGRSVVQPLVAYEPKLEGISGVELFTTAEPGVYREVGATFHNKTLFFVIVTGAMRTVLMQSGPYSQAQVASRSAWSTGRFKLTGKAGHVKLSLHAA